MTQARHAFRAGIDVLQVRERDLDAAELTSLVIELVALARSSATLVIVNDRVDVALAGGAGGVHLRGDSVPADAVRRMTPRGFVIGRSVHSLGEAVRSASAVDYLIAGSVWPTGSKPGRAPLGLDGLARISAAVRVPVLGIGGITVDRVGSVARAGAAGVAGIGVFMSEAPADPAHCRARFLEKVVDAMRREFDTSGSAS